MPRVTHVKSAQQRYATKPVIDPATGQQKRTPVMNGKTGEQKVSKRGPVFLNVTERDVDKPLPMPTCDAPACVVAPTRDGDKTIRPGDAYKHLTTKTTFSSKTYNRHERCPSWNVWEYSQSMSARIAQIEHDFETAISDDEMDNVDTVEQARSDAADAIRGIAEEKRESASNIEEGFGHPTQASEEFEEMADALDGWADEVDSADIPDPNDHPCDECSGSGEVDCLHCDGEGKIDAEPGDEEADENGRVDCEDCEGNGQIDCEECDEEHLDMEAWREAVREAGIFGECPV